MIAKEARKAREEQMLARQQRRLSQTLPTQGAFEIPTQVPPDHAAAQDPFKKKKERGRGRGKGGERGLDHTRTGHFLSAEVGLCLACTCGDFEFGGCGGVPRLRSFFARHRSTWRLVGDSTSGRRYYQRLNERQVCML